MEDKKIKKILEVMDGVSLQEWKNLKSHFDNKFYLNKNQETLKNFLYNYDMKNQNY